MQRFEALSRAKVFKVRCKSCGAEHVVEVSKPGPLLFVCGGCGAQHLMLLDHDLNLRALEPVETAEALPLGFYELDLDEELLPLSLRELASKLSRGEATPEDAKRALNLARRLGLLRRVGSGGVGA